MTSFKPNYLLQSPISNTVTFRLKVSAYEFENEGGDTIQPIKPSVSVSFPLKSSPTSLFLWSVLILNLGRGVDTHISSGPKMGICVAPVEFFRLMLCLRKES